MMVFTLILFYKSKICRSGIFAIFNFFFLIYLFIYLHATLLFGLDVFFLINTYPIYDPSVYSIKCVLLYNI